jgi:hypothetical protein
MIQGAFGHTDGVIRNIRLLQSPNVVQEKAANIPALGKGSHYEAYRNARCPAICLGKPDHWDQVKRMLHRGNRGSLLATLCFDVQEQPL